MFFDILISLLVGITGAEAMRKQLPRRRQFKNEKSKKIK